MDGVKAGFTVGGRKITACTNTNPLTPAVRLGPQSLRAPHIHQACRVQGTSLRARPQLTGTVEDS